LAETEALRMHVPRGARRVLVGTRGGTLGVLEGRAVELALYPVGCRSVSSVRRSVVLLASTGTRQVLTRVLTGVLGGDQSGANRTAWKGSDMDGRARLFGGSRCERILYVYYVRSSSRAYARVSKALHELGIARRCAVTGHSKRHSRVL
jgi:hypothetical protein